MKTLLLTFFLIFCGVSISQNLIEFNKKQNTINKRGMQSLTSWSTLNLGISAYGAATAEGEARYFHQMNIGWSAINLCLSVPGLVKAHRNKEFDLSPENTLKGQIKTEQVFLFNTALDVAYITGGFLLKERAKNDPENFQRFNGFGNAVILQGGFLFVFDLVMAVIHSNHRKKLYAPLELGFNQNGIGLRYTFN
ncbi:MAG: hypothetical protein MK078_06990 [Crocinitomicaceae bacterium]|nr:hypothetical protein [Crocinitomicaceae bacterium]